MDNKGYDKPNTLQQSLRHFDQPKWREAIQSEYDSLIKNETWELTAIPGNCQVITDRWCFKLKKTVMIKF